MKLPKISEIIEMFKKQIKEIKNINIKNINIKNINIKNINIKNITKNKELLIGLLSLLLFLFSIFYIIPDLLYTLFNTILGNSILLLLIILVITKNYQYGIVLIIIIIVLYRFDHFNNFKNKEGFTWTQDSITQFLQVQQTINPKIIFDTNEIQQQASQDEVNYFLKTGMWPWSQEVQQLYKKAIITNPYIRTDPEDAINVTRKIYNQRIILEMLSAQTKEGHFLLKGINLSDISNNNINNGFGNYGYTSGLDENTQNKNIIRCGIDASGNNSLQQIKYSNNDSNTQIITPVDYNNVSSLIPGFSFKNSPCNPCVALNSTPDYTCPFNLDISGNINQGTSIIWKYLWNTNPFQSLSSSFSNKKTIDPNQFPILNEINTEITTLFQNN